MKKICGLFVSFLLVISMVMPVLAEAIDEEIIEVEEPVIEAPLVEAEEIAETEEVIIEAPSVEEEEIVESEENIIEASADEEEITESIAIPKSSIVKVVSPANGSTLEPGEYSLYLRFINVNTSGVASSDAQYYTPVTLEVYRGSTKIESKKISIGSVNFTDKGANYGTLNLSSTGTYKIKVQAPGTPGYWDTSEITVKKASGGDTGSGDYPIGNDPRSGMNNYEIPGWVDDANNPGYYVHLDTTEVTIDLAGTGYGRLKFTEDWGDKTGYYCDWPEDQDGKIIKYWRMGDGYIDYKGVSVGTTKLHVYCMVNLTRYDHHVVTFKVIDSSKPSNTSAKTYSIKFNGNGSTSGSMDVKKCTINKSYNLTANAFKKKGYTFTGWNTKKDGSGKSYKNKASVKNLTKTKGKTVNLYAQWKANTYTVKFNANGGKGSMKKITATYGKSKSLPKNSFKKKGYRFAGWATSKANAKNGIVKYKNKKSIKNLTSKNKGTVTLYAVWKKK